MGKFTVNFNSEIPVKQLLKVSVLSGLILGLIAFGIFTCWPYCLKAPTPDESTFLYEGLLTAKGKLPYRDFFDFIWPGTFYLVAWLIQFSGGLSIVVVRVFTIAVLLTSGALTLIMGRAYLPKRWLCLLAGLFWMLHFPASIQVQHHILSSFMGIVAVFCLWKTIGKDQLSRSYLISSGLALSACTLFTQSLGIILILLMSGVVFSRALSQGASAVKQAMPLFAAAILTPILFTFGFFMWHHAWGDFWYGTSVWLFHGGYIQTSNHLFFFEIYPRLLTFFQTPHPSAADCMYFLLNLLYLILPVLGLCSGLTYCPRLLRRQNINPQDWELFLLFAATLGFLASTLSHSSFYHMAYNGWIPFMLGSVILAPLLRRIPKVETALLALMFVLFFITGVQQLRESFQIRALPMVRSFGTQERQLYWLQPDFRDTANVNQMLETIHQLSPPGDSLFVYNLAPEFYLLTNRDNPSRFQLLMAVLDTPAQIKEVTDALTLKKPMFILYEHQDERFFQAEAQATHSPIINYHLLPLEQVIQQHYTLFSRFSRYELYIEQSALAKLQSSGEI